MTVKEFHELEEGDKLRFVENGKTVSGVVTGRRGKTVLTEWDDGQDGNLYGDGDFFRGIEVVR